MEITLNNKSLTGQVQVIESKSFAHRLMLAAALAEAMTGQKTEVRMSNGSEDIQATRRVIRGLSNREAELDCGESGTTLRFSLPICGALGLRERTIFTGRGRLMERPMEPLLKAMEPHGVKVEHEDGHMALTGKLTPGNYTIAANVSSQYISGLLFALPLLSQNSSLRLEGQVESRPYIDITLSVLRQFGIEIDEDAVQNTFFIKGGQRYQSPGCVDVEGDWSNAAFWLAAGALGDGGPVRVTGLNLQSVQGDRQICRVLRQFGASVIEEEDGLGSGRVTVSRPKEQTLHPTSIDVKDIPDLVPMISVVAAAARGDSKIYNAGRLRLKESDRLITTAAMVRALGGQVEEGADYLLIHGTGSKLAGGMVEGSGDHRIVMSAAIGAALCRNPVTILGAEAVNKSYPGFFQEREKLL
ncbi:MAG: 3-phosphoshikimate 1-carboxyvinyltransferase [Firmicutes bacterium]|nr:3-phosphoshikimate 1-carboxyvinyltransferase [Bacillota bacterium]